MGVELRIVSLHTGGWADGDGPSLERSAGRASADDLDDLATLLSDGWRVETVLGMRDAGSAGGGSVEVAKLLVRRDT